MGKTEYPFSPPYQGDDETLECRRWMRRGGKRRDSRIGLSSHSRGQKIYNRQWPGQTDSMFTAIPEGRGKPLGEFYATKPTQ
ncbi:hypothetical protein ElyMa_003339800 [Elysia marginata]|uniref:Uncharacterized protein n=1 Tax=Elysia marginata TaxID=1093978 RepID=A0AAV4JHD2_9GAST|nr:hypothetical protein ElyMa_003339800 [Elysia marginata]